MYDITDDDVEEVKKDIGDQPEANATFEEFTEYYDNKELLDRGKKLDG